MKNLKYIIFYAYSSLITTSCQTTGGVWLKEGKEKVQHINLVDKND